jgi:hypothetical protein
MLGRLCYGRTSRPGKVTCESSYFGNSALLAFPVESLSMPSM